MKRLLILLAACLLLASCGTTASSLYYWGGNVNDATTYEHLTYKTYSKQTPEIICKLIIAYEDMVSHPTGSRQVPPPGICAEYGYLLLQPETADIFARTATPAQKKVFEDRSDYDVFFRRKGEKMLEREIELYPESVRFISPLLKKLTE